MNTQRFTISFPAYLYEYLIHHIPSGKVSSFVAQAVEKELVNIDNDPVEEFVSLRNKLPRKSQSQILRAIKQGRK